MRVLLLVAVVVAVVVVSPAQGASCSNMEFMELATTAIIQETRAYDAARKGYYIAASKWTRRAWTTVRAGAVPCGRALARFRALKLDMYLTLGAAYDSFTADDRDMGWFLLERARALQRRATAALNQA